MNVTILFVLLIVMTISNYIINNRNILVPSVIVGCVFTFSTSLVVFNLPRWQYDITLKTVFVITFSVFLFSISSYIGKSFVIISTLSNKKKKFTFDEFSFDFSNNKMKIFSSICIAVILYYFYYQYRLSLSLGNKMGILGVVGTLRKYVLTKPEIFQLSLGLNLGISFVRAMGFLSLFNICVAILCKDRRMSKYIVPVVCMFLYSILSTGRTAFIGYVTSVLFDIYIIQKKRGIIRFNKKMIRFTIIGFCLFLLVFWLLGYLTGKTQLFSFWDTLSGYAGASIVCFDDFLSRPFTFSSTFGQHTFVGIYNMLRKIGFNIPQWSLHADFVYWGGGKYESNIYTSFFPYIKDFGVIMAILLQVPLGVLFGVAWKRFNSDYASPVFLVLYGRIFGTALVMYSIAESLSGVLTMNFIAEIFFYYLITYFFREKRCLNEEIQMKEQIVT